VLRAFIIMSAINHSAPPRPYQAHEQPPVASTQSPGSAPPASMSGVANRIRTLLREDNIKSMLQNTGSPTTERDIIEIRTLLKDPDVQKALLQGPYAETIRAALSEVGALLKKDCINKMRAESDSGAAVQRRADMQASMDANWFKTHTPNFDGELDTVLDAVFESRLSEINEKLKDRTRQSSTERISNALTDIGTSLGQLSSR